MESEVEGSDDECVFGKMREKRRCLSAVSYANVAGML